MKLRKLIPGVVTVLLAVVLSVGLFVYAVPNALAVEEIEQSSEWALVESGYIRGMDHSIYPFTASLRFQTGLNAYSSTDTNWENPTPVVTVDAWLEVENESINEFPAINSGYCSLELYMYIPELDIYETQTMCWGTFYGQNVSCAAGGCDVRVYVEVDEQVYAGELIRVTAKYYLLGQEVATLNWHANSEPEA